MIPLPGVVFTIVFYSVLRISESVYVPTQKRWPGNYQEWEAHYRNSTLLSIGIAGSIALILCIAGAVILIRARSPDKKATREEIGIAAFYLFVLNAAISYGGGIAAESFGRVHDHPITEISKPVKRPSP
jgi:hypothetical protein